GDESARPALSEGDMTRAQVLLGLVIIVVVGGGIAYGVMSGRPPPPVAVPTPPEKKAAVDDTITDEEERLEYVSKHDHVEGLRIGPAYKPGDDAGIVPGLVRVSGTVYNDGDRGVKTIRVVVNPQDASGKVISSFQEDALGGKRLAPHDSRTFKFDIPE